MFLEWVFPLYKWDFVIKNWIESLKSKCLWRSTFNLWLRKEFLTMKWKLCSRYTNLLLNTYRIPEIPPIFKDYLILLMPIILLAKMACFLQWLLKWQIPSSISFCLPFSECSLMYLNINANCFYWIRNRIVHEEWDK